jgi:hypothetical protein
MWTSTLAHQQFKAKICKLSRFSSKF